MTATKIPSEAPGLWEAVRSDKDPTTWLLLKVSDDAKSLETVGSGSGGLSEFIKAFPPVTICFGGIRICAVDIQGGVQSRRVKFVRISILPNKVHPVKRGLATQLHGEVDNILRDCHTQMEVNDISEITPELLVRKLNLSAGAHKPNHYEFEPGELYDCASGQSIEGGYPNEAPPPPPGDDSGGEEEAPPLPPDEDPPMPPGEDEDEEAPPPPPED